MHDSHRRVADYLVSALAAVGVGHIFGVGGANIEDVYDAVEHTDGRVQAVVAKHEFAAACMAEGARRAAGGLGVVMATSGAGAMNLVPGIAEAYASRVPLLALIGQPPRNLEGHGAFQDSSGRAGAFDAVTLFSTISSFCARVDDPASIDRLLAEAIEATRAPRGGPAVLLIPKDVQQASAPGCRSIVDLLPSGRSAPAGSRPNAVRTLTDAVRRNDRILVIAGDGVGHHDARAELAELAHRLGADVAVTPEGKDVYADGCPRFVGVSGAIGHPTVQRSLEEADLCVLVGTRLPVMARAGLDAALAGTPVVAFDPELPFVDTAVHVDGYLRAELRAIVDALPARPLQRAAATGVELLIPPLPDTPGVRLPDAVRAINAALPYGATVVSDAGNASAAVIHYLSTPLRFIVAQGMGGMGHSFGAGIGAAFATGRRTYVLSGDGGFYTHGMEVHTAVEYDLPVTFVIFNNNAHAMCVTREQLFYGGGYSFNTFKPTEIGAGVHAMFPTLYTASVTTADELRQALVESNVRPGPALVCVEADPNEIPPFVPFLRQLGEASQTGAAHVAPVG